MLRRISINFEKNRIKDFYFIMWKHTCNINRIPVNS